MASVITCMHDYCCQLMCKVRLPRCKQSMRLNRTLPCRRTRGTGTRHQQVLHAVHRLRLSVHACVTVELVVQGDSALSRCQEQGWYTCMQTDCKASLGAAIEYVDKFVLGHKHTFGWSSQTMAISKSSCHAFCSSKIAHSLLLSVLLSRADQLTVFCCRMLRK